MRGQCSVVDLDKTVPMTRGINRVTYISWTSIVFVYEAIRLQDIWDFPDELFCEKEVIFSFVCVPDTARRNSFFSSFVEKPSYSKLTVTEARMMKRKCFLSDCKCVYKTIIVGAVSGPACSVSEGLPPATVGHQMADPLVLSSVHTSRSRRSCLPGTSCFLSPLKFNMVDMSCATWSAAIWSYSQAW